MTCVAHTPWTVLLPYALDVFLCLSFSDSALGIPSREPFGAGNPHTALCAGGIINTCFQVGLRVKAFLTEVLPCSYSKIRLWTGHISSKENISHRLSPSTLGMTTSASFTFFMFCFKHRHAEAYKFKERATAILEKQMDPSTRDIATILEKWKTLLRARATSRVCIIRT